MIGLRSIRAMCCATLAIVFSFAFSAARAADVEVAINPVLGTDARVDYARLLDYGPWDDRNYSLTQEDLALLAPNEAELYDPIPAFYRVELRRAFPQMKRSGSLQYPRSAFNVYEMRYGGYLHNGTMYRELRRIRGNRYVFSTHDAVRAIDFSVRLLNGEARVTAPTHGGAETAVAINPTNRDRVIAGSNGPGGGQKMWTSTNGGETWTQSGNLPTTFGSICCDPAIAWTADGNTAFTATLAACTNLCNVVVYKSTDQGATWGSAVRLSTGGQSDKEYMHIDTHATSPHAGKIYVAWHDFNTQRFARSTDGGTTFSTPITIDGANEGIGSDLTSDKNGNVYYIYPATNLSVIRVAKSTDGGATFAAATTLAATLDDYDFAIPAMETRRAFIYVAADADTSNGTFGNSLYAAWTDTTGPENATPANNHARIQVAFSRDGGATWSTRTPHPTADANTVDRFHPWLKVDSQGRVHVVFYDTRNSSARTGVDFYYSRSENGGDTWTDPVRITTVTSPNITGGFEWGDYNGLDVQLEHALAIYTDNRIEPGEGTNTVDAYVSGGFTTPTGTYTMTGPATVSACAGAAVPPRTINVTSVGGYANPVTLTTPGINGAVFGTATFSPNPVTPTGNSTLTVSVLPTATTGDYTIPVQGSGSSTPPIIQNVSVPVHVDALIVNAPGLSAPAGGAFVENLRPTFSWTAVTNAVSYRVEISTSASFPAGSTLVATVAAPTLSYAVPSNLDANTRYYWRVTAVGACGDGPSANARTFVMGNLMCFNGNVSVPDNNAAGVDNNLDPSGSGALSGMRVSLKATHTFVGNLRATLTHVSTGTSVVLIDRPGVPATANGCANDNIDVVLFDAASTNAEDQCVPVPPAIGGVQRPTGSLGAFTTEALTGQWRLTVSDLATGETGTLTEWCLLPAGVTLGEIFRDGFE
jgi:subtilisin-like proprotein convertase family protein